MRSRFSKSRLVLVSVLIALLTVSLPLWAAELVILHNNDVHSRLSPTCPRKRKRYKVAGCAWQHWWTRLGALWCG